MPDFSDETVIYRCQYKYDNYGRIIYITTLGKEKNEIRIQIEEFKGYRELMTAGDFYRVKSPFDGNEVAWLIVSKDKKEAVVGYYRILMPVNDGLRRVRLTGLNPEFDYKVEKKKARTAIAIIRKIIKKGIIFFSFSIA